MAPAIGRTFVATEDRPGAPTVALIGAGLRHGFFNTDREALGKTVRLAGIDFTIIGVLPSSFTAPDMSPVDLVLPIENAPWFGGREALVNRDFQWVRIVGRLRPGSSAAAASAEASAIYRRANVGVRAVDQTTLARETIPVRSLREARRDPSAPSARVSVWLTALAAVVLLIACANVASLFVARGVADQHELAIHVALGATSGRLARRALLEVGILVVLAVRARADHSALRIHRARRLAGQYAGPHADWMYAPARSRLASRRSRAWPARSVQSYERHE
jgi:hypothetical protein